ncbi:MAG TPA: response regulator transcription factor [Candidatus Eisenbacteria bacterium]|jgi:DNA-binding NarL/FixJ family response regulator|nr:response regulator transcription factor [Candidatus Eisenbacteria bacterium]
MKKSAPKARRKKVFLVDDHPAMRQGLKELIDQERDLAVCGQAADIPSALEGIEKTRPDIAVVDLTLKDQSGLQLVKDLKIRQASLPVLVLSMHSEALYAERSIRAGARGYIMKEATTENIVEAIRKVLGGDVYLSADVSSKVLNKMAGGSRIQGDAVENLSDRELEVFNLIGQGLRTRDIAEKLNLSVKTVESYREHIKTKLQLDNAAKLTRAAVEWAQSRR